MKFTLQELLNQKNLLLKHLAWLNSKIEEHQNESFNSSGESNSLTSTAPTFNSEITLKSQSPEETDKYSLAESITQQYQPTQRSDSSMIKIGCFAVVIGICIFFIFVLFFLPNWLYPD